MLTVIDNPNGIDVPIRKLQEKLYSSLMEAWGLDPENPEQNALYECYPRCYRNKKDNGYVAEIYKGANEYRDAYWDDKLNAISFFGISNNIKHDVGEKAEVHLVFFVNLSKLKPALSTRGDEEVRLDVLNIVQAEYYGFTFKGVDLWIENVLKEYQGSIRDKRLADVDMHPIHCFRINFLLIYDSNNCY